MEEAMPDVRCEQKGQALWLTIDREERRNALNEAVFDGLRAGIAQADESPEIRAGDRARQRPCARRRLRPRLRLRLRGRGRSCTARRAGSPYRHFPDDDPAL